MCMGWEMICQVKSGWRIFWTSDEVWGRGNVYAELKSHSVQMGEKCNFHPPLDANPPKFGADPSIFLHRGVGQTPWVGHTPLVCPPPLDGCRPPQGLYRPPWMQTPGVGQTPQARQTPLDADPPGLGRPPWMQTPPGLGRPPPIQSISGRYASYWNAYLYLVPKVQKAGSLWPSRRSAL